MNLITSGLPPINSTTTNTDPTPLYIKQEEERHRQIPSDDASQPPIRVRQPPVDPNWVPMTVKQLAERHRELSKRLEDKQ